jgi:Zn finger protein HypA/HybF involved in hydrogenase expression
MQVNFEDFFNFLIEETIENSILNTALENSMESYDKELFKKKDDFIMKQASIKYKCLNHKDGECFICLEKFKETAVVYELPCKHIFHKSCLDNAIRHQHYHCPMCKSKIETVKNNIVYHD